MPEIDISEFLTEAEFIAKALNKTNSVDSENNRRLQMDRSAKEYYKI